MGSTRESSAKEPKHAPITYEVSSGRALGGKISLEQTRSPDQLRQLLHWQDTDISNAELNVLLDWVSMHVKDFLSSGTFQVEGWQAVGQKLFNLARNSDANTYRLLATWGADMGALKESRAEILHFTTSETDSSEPSCPPAPTSNTPGYPEVSPSPPVLPAPDENPYMVGPVDPGLSDSEQEFD